MLLATGHPPNHDGCKINGYTDSRPPTPRVIPGYDLLQPVGTKEGLYLIDFR